jgi:hypothetical protein
MQINFCRVQIHSKLKFLSMGKKRDLDHSSRILCEYDTIEPSSMLYQGQQVMNERVRSTRA